MEAVISEARLRFSELNQRECHPYVVDFLDQNPSVNQCYLNHRGQPCCTVMTLICRVDLHTALALLLNVPGLDVNQHKAGCFGPALTEAVSFRSGGCLRLLLQDPRVEMRAPASIVFFPDGASIMHFALRHRCLQGAKWLMALRPFEENHVPGDLSRWRSPWMHERECVDLYLDYQRDPLRVRHCMRMELGFREAFAAEIFAVIILFADDFFILHDHLGPGAPRTRFLSMARRLPLELQMLLAWRAQGDPREVILSSDFEPAVVHVAN